MIAPSDFTRRHSLPSRGGVCLDQYQPRPGDLYGFSGDSWAGSAPVWDNLAIKLGTLSRFTHVAGCAEVRSEQLDEAARWKETFLIGADGAARLRGSQLVIDELRWARWHWRTRPLLIESTTLCPMPCEILQRRVVGVQAHDPITRIRTYRGRVWLYRPTPDWELDADKSDRLTAFLLRHVGDGYDLPGALASASRVLKNRWWYYPANRHALFCSALWDAALQQISLLGPEDYSVVNPAVLLRHLVKIGRYECVGEFQITKGRRQS